MSCNSYCVTLLTVVFQFAEDFLMTACMALLKRIIEMHFNHDHQTGSDPPSGVDGQSDADTDRYDDNETSKDNEFGEEFCSDGYVIESIESDMNVDKQSSLTSHHDDSSINRQADDDGEIDGDGVMTDGDNKHDTEEDDASRCAADITDDVDSDVIKCSKLGLPKGTVI